MLLSLLLRDNVLLVDARGRACTNAGVGVRVCDPRGGTILLGRRYRGFRSAVIARRWFSIMGTNIKSSS